MGLAIVRINPKASSAGGIVGISRGSLQRDGVFFKHHNQKKLPVQGHALSEARSWRNFLGGFSARGMSGRCLDDQKSRRFSSAIRSNLPPGFGFDTTFDVDYPDDGQSSKKDHPSSEGIVRFREWAFIVPLIGLLLPVNAAAGEVQEGRIIGRVGLTDREGTPLNGDWVRVFLTTEELPVPVVDLQSAAAPLERRSRINSGHMDFFVNFQQRQNQDGYLVDHKLTRPDGTFAFHGIPPGRYWVVVTFPTMIAGYKCAWQAAVDVNSGEDAHVTLNGENLAVPAF